MRLDLKITLYVSLTNHLVSTKNNSVLFKIIDILERMVFVILLGNHSITLVPLFAVYLVNKYTNE